jgi:hypothetical protein
MQPVRPIISAVSCSLLLYAGLGLSDVASSDSGMILKGKVLRIEGTNYFVKNREDGKEVRLQIDKNTQITAVGINTGDNVMAKIDDQNHVESILTDQSAPMVQRDKALEALESR